MRIASRSHLALLILLAGFCAPLMANAFTVSYTASATGNLCKIYDANPSNGLNDCNEINQQNGNPQGLFSLTLTGLARQSLSAARFRLTVADADVFAPTGGNSTGEFFGLFLDSLFLGTLFDGSTKDESAGPARGLAGAVQSSIARSGAAPHALDLGFTLQKQLFNTLIRDGTLTTFFDFRQDRNINRFVNPSITVSYTTPKSTQIAAVALPGTLGLLLAAFVMLLLFAQVKHHLPAMRAVAMLKKINPLPRAKGEATV